MGRRPGAAGRCSAARSVRADLVIAGSLRDNNRETDFRKIVAAVEPDFLPPRQTHESGQVVLDRRRHFDSMLLALQVRGGACAGAYAASRGLPPRAYRGAVPHRRGLLFRCPTARSSPLIAPPPLPTLELQLMSYPSKTFEIMMDNLSIMGDKEMFPWGATALGREYAVIKYGVGAAGTDMGGFQGRAMEQFGPDGLLQFMHAKIPEWTCDSVPRLPLAENQRFPLLRLPEGSAALREYLSRPEWAAAGGLKWPALETSLWALVRGLCSAMD